MVSKEITLTTGQIANCWNDFEKIASTNLKKSAKDFYNIPVSVIVKRSSNNQPVDHLSIENISMSKDGTEVWFECFVNDKLLVEREPKVKEHLDESEKKYSNLSGQLDNKIEKK